MPGSDFSFVDKKSEEIKKTYPLLEFFDFGSGKVLVYDAKAHFSFVLGKDHFSALLDFLGAKTLRGGVGMSGIFDKFEALRKSGVFLAGPAEEIAPTSGEALAARLAYYAENIIFRKFCLEVTQDCNLRCKYCPYTLATNGRRHHKAHMSFDVARKAIDYYFKRYVSLFGKVPAEFRHRVYESGAPSLLWYGGETLLNFKLIKETKKYFESLPWAEHGVDTGRIRYSINTNMILLDEEVLEFLVENRVITQISLDGPKDIHDRNRVFENGEGSFDVAFRNILRLKKRSPEHFEKNTFLISVETDPAEAEKRREFFEREGIDKARRFTVQADYRGSFVAETPFSRAETMKEDVDEFNGKVDSLSEKDFSRFFTTNENRFQILQRGVWSVQHDSPVGASRLELTITCPMGFDQFMVDFRGDIHMCHKTDGSVPIGNIDSGLDIVKISSHYKILHTASNNDCASCWAVRMCKFCAANKVSNGGFQMPRKEECSRFRNIIKRSFYMDISLRKNPALMKYIRERYKSVSKDTIVDIQRIIGSAEKGE